METALCDCESVTIARPLTYVSEDASDLASIRPSTFLLDLKQVGLPECNAVDSSRLNWQPGYC